MLPDFSGVQQPANEFAPVRSSEPSHSAASRYVKSFFVQHFSEKVLHSGTKHRTFCPKHLNKVAKLSTFVTHSLQNDAPQAAVIPSLTPAVSDQPDDIAHFYELWTALPSWSPIVKKADGWITITNHSGKKVPLVLGTVASYYRRDYILGKRFGKLTNYLMIDVDINSPFHPRNGGIEQILAAMEALGLCRYLLVRSSNSEGIHIYFPLPEPVSAWGLACAAHAALTAAGIAVAGGICELFPNKKARDAEHNGHRLPLQTGSFILDQDFCPVSNLKADFVARWQTAAAHQDEQQLQRALSGNAVYVSPSPLEPLPAVAAPQRVHTASARVTHVIPPLAWTSIGQSNEVMRELVNYGDRYLGHKTIAELADWVRAVAPQLPGYEQFASPKSKRDIERGTWPLRWAKSHFNSVYAYKVSGTDHNANVARDARARIFAALDLMCVTATIGVTELFKNITNIAKHCLNRGIHWNTLKKYEDEIWAYIKQTGKLGLSTGGEEDINSFSSELPAAEIIEPEIPSRKSFTELITLRYVAGIYSSVFARLHTPKKAAEVGGGSVVQKAAKLADKLPVAEADAAAIASSALAGGQAEREGDGKGASISMKRFAAGQHVRIVMPGGSLDGIETQVLAPTVDVLGQPVYRLDYQRQGRAITLPAECLQAVERKSKALPGEAVIRATAAQLLQVLGKACPFVGPGLWTVKREEVSPLAWRQLIRLVGEG